MVARLLRPMETSPAFPAPFQVPVIAPRPRWLPGLPAAVGAALAIVALLAGCAEPPHRPIDLVRDETFTIRNPGEADAAATGIGCGLNKGEALANARRAARFNLQGVIGPRHYELRFEVLRQVPDSNRMCFEVEAAIDG